MTLCECNASDYPCGGKAQTQCPVCLQRLCRPCYTDHHDCQDEIKLPRPDARELVPA